MFAENLQALRKQKGWSQEQLADAIGVTRQTVSKWELGSTTPELEKLLALSQLFAISLDELTGNPSAPAQSKQEPQPVMHGAGFFGGMGMRPYFHLNIKASAPSLVCPWCTSIWDGASAMPRGFWPSAM